MTPEVGKGPQEVFKLRHFTIKGLDNWRNPDNTQKFDLTKLRGLIGLAQETGFILSAFPTSSFPELNSTQLIIPSDPDRKPIVQHNVCVAYKYHPVGGMNSIEIQEVKEVGGRRKKRQIELSFNGHTTGFKKVALVTSRQDLGEALKELISIGREAGGESEFNMHGLNHPTTIYYPDFLPQ